MNTFTHMAIEVYCGYEYREDKTKQIPDNCKYGIGQVRNYCINCSFMSFAAAPNQISYSDNDGEASSKLQIGFGGEMEPDDITDRRKLLGIWKEICDKKIKEAYTEYMKIKNELSWGKKMPEI